MIAVRKVRWSIMASQTMRRSSASVNQDASDPFAKLAQRHNVDPFSRLGQDQPRRITVPTIADIEHREAYDAIRKRNLLDSVKDQEAIERAENPDLLDRFGEALKETVWHPLRTAGGIITGAVEPVMKAISPSKEAAARANAPNSRERMILSAKVGTPAMAESAPFGAGVTTEERLGGIAGTLAMGVAPGVSASLPKFLGASALAGAASAPDDPMLGAAMGTTLGAAARTLRRAPIEPLAYSPAPAPKVTGIPAAAPAPPSIPAIDRFRALRFGLGDADPSVELKVRPVGAPTRRPAPRPPVEPGPEAATASFGDPDFLPSQYGGRALTGVRRRPGPKTTNEPGTPAAEAQPFSTKGVAGRRRAGDVFPTAPAPNPFDDLAIKEAETRPAPVVAEPAPGTPAAEAVPFAMGGQESRIPKAPPQPRGPRAESPVLGVSDETAHAGKGVVSSEPDLTAQYPAGTPRAMDQKTLANAVKRTGLSDEAADAARQHILDSGYQPVRVTFAEQAKVAEQLAGTLGVEVKALRPDLARRMSVPDMYARITRASTNVKLMEGLSRELTEGTLRPDEAANLTSALEKLETENQTIYGDVLVAGSQKGRELGAMRMIARLSTDPAVWEVQAMRKLGGKPLPDSVRSTVRRMAAEVAEACAL